MEKALGVALTTSTTRKLHITEAGKAYFDHSQAAVSDETIFSRSQAPVALGGIGRRTVSSSGFRASPCGN
jgi:DNA-binding transcriptional LysR family regulator